MSSAAPSRETAELIIRFEHWIRRVPLANDPVVLGRSSDCDVQLSDPKLSRHHCRLFPGEDGLWLVEDLGSQGGTLVGGEPIHEPTPLGPRDHVQIGSMVLCLERRPALASLISGDPARDARNVELLLGTVDDLYGTKDLQELLRTVVDRAILLAGADRGALLLANPGGALETVISRDAGKADLPADETLTRSLPARALQSGRAIVLTDLDAPEQRHNATKSVFAGELRTVLCVPLPGPGGAPGVLYVDGRRPAEEFGASELAIFEALATHGALAIERARLREEQARRQEEARGRLQTENAALRARLGTDEPVGESEPMRSTLELVRKVAASEATVCLTGETGTGKEILARYVHRLSPRNKGPFVVVDCGAIPEGLIESELFGHEKGAFTGASAAREGRFREAEGGTAFLDEIAELPLLLQTRLLRVLQERTVQPVGANERVPVDVRVVCATHQDLEQRIAEGRFREDLYYRIAVFSVPVPPLRARGADILLLAEHFLARYAAAFGAGVTGFTREAKEALLAHPWPGNIRELENRIQRAVILASPPSVSLRDLWEVRSQHEAAPSVRQPEENLSSLPLQQARAEATERFERTYLEQLLERTGGNVAQAAAAAEVSRQLFWRLVRRHGIVPRQLREGADK